RAILSARGRAGWVLQAGEIGLKLSIGNFGEFTAVKRLDTRFELLAQRLKLERVLTASLLESAQRIPHGFARILVLTRFHRSFDEGILLAGEADIAGRHVSMVPVMAKFANSQFSPRATRPSGSRRNLLSTQPGEGYGLCADTCVC